MDNLERFELPYDVIQQMIQDEVKLQEIEKLYE